MQDEVVYSGHRSDLLDLFYTDDEDIQYSRALYTLASRSLQLHRCVELGLSNLEGNFEQHILKMFFYPPHPEEMMKN